MIAFSLKFKGYFIMELKFTLNSKIPNISANYLLFLNILKSWVNLRHFNFQYFENLHIKLSCALFKKETQWKIQNSHSIKSQAPLFYKLSMNLSE